MAASAERFTVSATATALNTADSVGHRLVVKNTHATADADLGASTVTAGTGFPLPAGQSVPVEVDSGEVLFAIRSGVTDVTLAVLRT